MFRLVADSYLIRDDGNLDYQRDLLVSNRHRWAYSGVTHEYIHCDTARTRGKLPELTITHHCDGGTRKEKSTRDLDLLTKGLEEEPENSRYMFYLAQTYKDIGDHESALAWYNRRIAVGGWAKEAWYSTYQAARMQHAMGMEWSVVSVPTRAL